MTSSARATIAGGVSIPWGAAGPDCGERGSQIAARSRYREKPSRVANTRDRGAPRNVHARLPDRGHCRADLTLLQFLGVREYSVELIAAQGHAVIVQRWPLDRTFWSTSTTKVDPVSPEADPVLGCRRNVLALSNGA
jgi:hypothetical protein